MNIIHLYNFMKWDKAIPTYRLNIGDKYYSGYRWEIGFNTAKYIYQGDAFKHSPTDYFARFPVLPVKGNKNGQKYK
jgi:hypothetical protein